MEYQLLEEGVHFESAGERGIHTVEIQAVGAALERPANQVLSTSSEFIRFHALYHSVPATQLSPSSV